MIVNEREYASTRGSLSKFRESLELVRSGEIEMDDALREAYTRSLDQQITELEEVMQNYRDVMDGKSRTISIRSLYDIADALLLARQAEGLSQEELGSRMGVRTQQQVQRYEANRYTTARFERLQEVLAALDLEFEGCLRLPRTALESADTDVGTTPRFADWAPTPVVAFPLTPPASLATMSGLGVFTLEHPFLIESPQNVWSTAVTIADLAVV